MELENCDLNESQRKAVEYIDGPSLVIAGAGSGKTRVLTYKIAYLLERGMMPWNILALTFTNKAAKEMRNRIGQLVGEQTARYLYMGTFHSIFSRILRREAERIGYSSNFTIYDESDSRSLIKSIIKEMNLDDKVYKPATVHHRISMAKNHLILPDLYANDKDALQHDREARMPAISAIYSAYCARCRQANAMDFDDLLTQTYTLFNEHEEVRQQYADRFRFVLVDEYQDTNSVQQRIVYQLTREHQHVCVVGDDAQSIYGFRGANIDNILDFQQIYDGTKLFKLEQNYRSTQYIVQAANSLIRKNERQIHKDVYSQNDQGERLIFKPAYSDKEEAIIVCNDIKRIRREEKAAYSDFAILYRTNAQSRSFEEVFRKENIPYRIYGGLSFYQRKEIKDIICYLRMLVYADDLSFIRTVNTPKRQFGPKKMAILQAFADTRKVGLYEALLEIVYEAGRLNDVAPDVTTQAELSSVGNDHRKIDFDCKEFLSRSNVVEYVKLIEKYRSRYKDMRVSELLSKMLRETKYEEMVRLDGDEDRLDNLAELKQGILEFENYYEEDASLDEYLQNIVLFTNADEDVQEKDRVQLMTIHNAKGLEFPYVFVCGLNEGFFPVKRVQNKIQLEEERRLAYVAFTRAENVLCLSDAEDGVAGESGSRYPSRFLLEMDMGELDVARGFSDDLLLAARDFIAEADRNRDLMGDFDEDESLGAVKKAPTAEFAVGDRVVHKIFGIGTVSGVDKKNFCYEITFDKFATPRSIQFDFPLSKV